MNARLTFDDALDRAITAMQEGRPLESVLRDYPAHATSMRPLLEVMSRAQAPLASPRLQENFTIVRAAVQRAQIANGTSSAASPRSQTPWWRKRWALASMTAPAGLIVALLTVGAGGAAAASIAVINPDVTARVVGSVAPSWVESLVHNGDDPASPGDGAQGPGDRPGSGPSGAPGGPLDGNGPVEVEVAGTVGELRGNVFVLSAPDGDYKVNIDASSMVDGELADGASATVSGDLTADKNLHADSVTVTAAPAAAPPDDSGPQNDHTPGAPAGEPAADKTPKPTKTPSDNGQPVDRTPPGQDRGGGGGSESGQGSGSGTTGTGQGGTGANRTPQSSNNGGVNNGGTNNGGTNNGGGQDGD
jgi:hypothetical protein